jgi:hypothetical protein
LNSREQASVQRAKHALVSDYDADSYGFPDPEWTGAKPKGNRILLLPIRERPGARQVRWRDSYLDQER